MPDADLINGRCAADRSSAEKRDKSGWWKSLSAGKLKSFSFYLFWIKRESESVSLRYFEWFIDISRKWKANSLFFFVSAGDSLAIRSWWRVEHNLKKRAYLLFFYRIFSRILAERSPGASFSLVFLFPVSGSSRSSSSGSFSRKFRPRSSFAYLHNLKPLPGLQHVPMRKFKHLSRVKQCSTNLDSLLSPLLPKDKYRCRQLIGRILMLS